MGDRVLFQVVDKDEFSPVIYGHWCGSDVPRICRDIKKRMKGREGDMQYTAARLVQEMIGRDSGNMGFGIWNTDHILTEDETHYDAGIVLIDVSEEGMKFQCFGGYYKINTATGFPVLCEELEDDE